jgi:glutaredoxin
VDSDGKTHFTESKPAGSAAMQKFTVTEEQAYTAAPASRPVQAAAAAPPQVDLYVTSWCPYCKKAIAFLRRNNIAFNVYDIERDFAAATRKKELDPNYEGVPLAVINRVKIRGFDEAEFRAALAK